MKDKIIFIKIAQINQYAKIFIGLCILVAHLLKLFHLSSELYFLVYFSFSADIIFLALLFLIKNINHKIIITMFTSVKDMLLTLACFYFFKYGLIVIFIISFAWSYLSVNNRLYRSTVFLILTQLYMLAALPIIYILYSWIPVTYAFIAFVCLNILSYYEKNKLINDEIMYENHLALKDQYDLSRTNINLVKHDINNQLSILNDILINSKMHKCKSSCEQTILNYFKKMQSYIDRLGTINVIKYNLFYMIQSVIQETGYLDNISLHPNLKETELVFNLNIFKSIIYNLITNAKEAYLRKHRSLKRFHVDIYQNKGLVYIEDNAGGFDINNISKNQSSKKNPNSSNGNFLFEITRLGQNYNIHTELEKINNGTRIKIQFFQQSKK